MNVLDQPLRFLPYLRPMVWGGRALSRYIGKNLPPGASVGEAWELSDHPTHRSVVAVGRHYGTTLRALMQHHGRALLGAAASRYETFPWLVKLLDAADWLSVQVHPDEKCVARWRPGEGAKSEAWLVLDALPTGRIYAGLRAGVGPADFRQALERGRVVDLLHSFTPSAGDLVYLPAGTVHALGGGVLLAEVQQTSDATFRLFDWNRCDAQGRPRALHIEEGLACVDWRGGPVTPVRAEKQEGLVPLLRSPYFALESASAAQALELGGDGRMRVLIVTQGQGRLDSGDFFLAGDVWLLPASMPTCVFHPETPLHGLLVTLPE